MAPDILQLSLTVNIFWNEQGLFIITSLGATLLN